MKAEPWRNWLIKRVNAVPVMPKQLRRLHNDR